MVQLGQENLIYNLIQYIILKQKARSEKKKKEGSLETGNAELVWPQTFPL